MERFVHLGARSDASPGRSLARIDALVRLAHKDGQPALGLCDAMSLAGAPTFCRAARRLGVRPVLGAELRMTALRDWPAGTTFGLRVLAATPTGWRRLVEVLNGAADQTAEPGSGVVEWDTLFENLDGLVLLWGGLDSELSEAHRRGRGEEAVRLLEVVGRQAGAERLFVALPAPVDEAGRALTEFLAQAATRAGLTAVAVPEVHYAAPEDELAWRIWSASESEAFAPGTRLGDLARPVEQRTHLLTAAEAHRLYADYPGAVEAAIVLAGRCEAEVASPARRFPRQEFARGVDADSLIWNEVFARASQHYGDLPARWRERLNREFRDLIEADLADALLCLGRLDGALRDTDILRGPGAGFLTNSLVASLLGVTRLDPLRHDLAFSLPEGAGQRLPRLEIRLAEGSLDAAGRLLDERFPGHVCRVGRWQRWSSSSVLDRLLRQVGWQGMPAARLLRSKSWEEAAREANLAPEGKDPPAEWTLADVRTLAWLVPRLEGRLRRLRVLGHEHVFTAVQMDRELPRAPSADKLPVTQWEAKDLERLGYGRVAFARDRTLDLIEQGLRHLREQGRPCAELTGRLAQDETTFELLREARTQGIRLFDPPPIRRRLRQLQPSDFPSLLRVVQGRRAGALQAETFEEVLVAVWAAALKAHEAEAFYAAALTLAAPNAAETNALLEEVRAQGLTIRPLDLNCSMWHWTPEDGALRPGLVTVRGMTPEAGHEIEWTRRELAFPDLADLLRRTDPRMLRTGQVEALVRAGALDSLGPTRDELLANLPRLDQLLRPRRAGANGEDPLHFFGHGADWWLEHHVVHSEWITTAGDDSAQARLESQRAATGLFLEADPLDVQREFWKAARLLLPRDLGNRDRGHDVTLAAPPGSVWPPDPTGGEGPCSVELAGVQAEIAGPWTAAVEQALREGDWLVLAGRIDRETFQWILTAEVVRTFDETLARARHATVLTLQLSGLDRRTLKELLALLKSFPGRTPVERAEADGQTECERLADRIASRRVLVCPGLELGLGRLLPPGTWHIDVPRNSVGLPESGTLATQTAL
ncbi:MAG: PHP domain-containing protein [Candidatus Sumerlaeia bacterium]|nr:PHP domain-containing protein [Candidatus Sumerlaeia bacterium]